jgi:hypothetical protein
MGWHMVDDWYKGKSCAYCQKPFCEIHWLDRQPALRGPDRNTAQRSEIPPENWPYVFQNFLSVCWNCFIAKSYRRPHPEQLVDRRWERGVGGAYVPKEPADDVPQKPVGDNQPQDTH